MRIRLFLLHAALAAAVTLTGCAGLQPLSKPDADRAQGIASQLSKAEEMGARECAPKDLAKAQARLDIARHEATESIHESAAAGGYFQKAEAAAADVMAKTEACERAKKAKAPPPPPPAPPPRPKASLGAEPSKIQQGQSATLSWSTKNATDISIDGLGAVGPDGSKTVSPQDSTTYRLIAKGPGGSEEATTRVTVTPPPPPPVSPPPPPAAAVAVAAPTASLGANPVTIQQGQSSTLTWATENASDVSIDGLGAVAAKGSQGVTPRDTTTYRLVAKGPGGTREASTVVTVTPPPAPTASLSANPDTIQQGQSSTLTWATENASDVSIDGLGAVAAKGSQGVTPRDTTTYRLVAKGPGGTREASTVVTVTPPPAPTASLSANPGTIQQGQSSTLTWATENASDVSIDGLGAVAAKGSQGVTPRDTTTYRLVAKGPGGTREASTVVTVTPPPAPTATLRADPGTVQKGNATTLTWATENATDVSIERLGAVSAKGSQSITPLESTTYRLVAKGPGGTAEAAAPVTVTPPPPSEEKVHMTLEIEFDTDKANIKPKYHAELAKLGDFMKKYPTVNAVIEGNTDNVGKEAHNVKLSQERAESVVSYLVKHFGIEASRLSAKGNGSSKPEADNATAAGRQRNRRTVAVIDAVVQK